MQPDRNEASSDLERARALSRALRGASDEAGSAPALPRFEPAGSGAGDDPFATAEPRPMAPERALDAHGDVVHEDVDALAVAAMLQPDALGSRFWNELLVQCVELARAEGATGAFAVDSQGLSIGQIGNLDPDEVEGTGSRLVIALEQAARMESFASHRPGSILIEFGDRWLTGFSIDCGPEAQIVLGIVAHEPLGERTRDLISNLVSELTSGA